jgi:mono/diheme cytochrome c family protein
MLRPLFTLGALLTLAACGGGDQAPPPDAPPPIPASTPTPGDPAAFLAKGQATYQQICVSCHQADGTGMPGVYPPLDGSEWLTGDARVPIAIVLHGMMGPITVAGQTYDNMMTAWGAMLSDEDAAAVVSYVRATYGNGAGPVTAADVAAIREAEGQRGPWTADEVKAKYGG